MIGVAPFDLLSRKPSIECFVASIDDVEKALTPKKIVDPTRILSREYHDFLNIFSQEAADTLPPYRSSDHKIKFV